MNQYWEDKAAQLGNIKIPAYVGASYTNPIHTYGSFEGFRRIASKEKWLRVHNTTEWPDYYAPEHVEDLRRFFDRYLKGIQNGWEKTPKVRLSVLDLGGEDTVDRPESDWPVPGTKNKKFFLQQDKSLTDDAALSSPEGQLSYEIKGKGSAVELLYKVPKAMELIGYTKVRLWVEADGSNDMELTVAVTKRDPNNKAYPSYSPFPVAAAGLLRVSHRALDPVRSTELEPYHLHIKEEMLKPGVIVPIEVGLWPQGLRFRPGETLVLVIEATSIDPLPTASRWGTSVIEIPADGGTYMPNETVTIVKIGGTQPSPQWVRDQSVVVPKTRNAGRHIIHFGGKYDSHVLMPIKMV
jgi:predicted acyl esterase